AVDLELHGTAVVLRSLHDAAPELARHVMPLPGDDGGSALDAGLARVDLIGQWRVTEAQFRFHASPPSTERPPSKPPAESLPLSPGRCTLGPSWQPPGHSPFQLPRHIRQPPERNRSWPRGFRPSRQS